MIVGIGTDIVEVERIDSSLASYGEAFAKRILADMEWEQYLNSKQPAKFLAKRFAAKEAFSKAMGTGLRSPVTFNNIAVMHDDLGKPELRFAAELQILVDEKEIVSSHISISDEKNLAVAFVVLERA